MALNQRKPETILIGDDLYILWRDGHESHYAFVALRDACPCANCIDELTGKKTLQSSSIPPNIRVRTGEYIGNYALRIQWSDGHNTGLYSFRLLRSLCPCALCQSQRTSTQEVLTSVTL